MSAPGVPKAPRAPKWLDPSVLTLRRAVSLIIGVAVALAATAALLEWLVDSSFATFGDAAWFAVVTVSTVGYGDVVPSTTGGRFIASALMLVGLGLIPLITSVVVSILVSQRTREVRENALEDLKLILDRLDRIERLLGEHGRR
ncbi:MAG TPA: potassium channel family protein [Gaiellaceae bacterium]|jgi:voltage-gated potassium channel|nr:potassium channel family protein [Gaiellaceae bacterium]